jgi:heterodisulfide reductase subunit B
MEQIVALLGAQTVRWPMATECCGASFALSRKQVVLRQGLRIYQTAKDAGADVLCLACPMCHANLDMREAEFADGARDLPVVYLTQLIGLALGITADELGMHAHFVPVEAALAKISNGGG